MKVHASSICLACCEFSPRLSSATAATLGFLGFGWFNLPLSELERFPLDGADSNFFLKCFHQWFVRVHLVHCPLAFRWSTIFWSIPVCGSAEKVRHRPPRWIRGSSYATFTHETSKKDFATPASSADVGTVGCHWLGRKLGPLTKDMSQEDPAYNTVDIAAGHPTGSCSQDI